MSEIVLGPWDFLSRSRREEDIVQVRAELPGQQDHFFRDVQAEDSARRQIPGDQPNGPPVTATEIDHTGVRLQLEPLQHALGKPLVPPLHACGRAIAHPRVEGPRYGLFTLAAGLF